MAHTCSATADSAWSAAIPRSNTISLEGNYKVCVKVSDLVNPPAVMASGVFTIDRTGPGIDAGAALVLNASSSLGPIMGDANSQVWSGPAEISFSDANAPTTSVSASMDGAYILTLTAYDSAGNVSTDTVSLTWDTAGPTVNVGGDITIGVPVSRTASVGTDASSPQWSQESGPGTIVFSDEDSSRRI